MIGIFGGTFDPIHFGHLRPALELRERLQLEEIRFVPCRQPPHRDVPSATPDQRLRMVRAAIAGIAGFAVDERELQRPGPSYMVDTLESLRRDLPEAVMCLLLGMDALLGFARWHRWQRILELAHLVVAHRPGWGLPEDGDSAGWVGSRLSRDVADLRRRPAGSVVLQPVTQLEISATAVRETIASGGSPKFLVPDAVCNVIVEQELYRNPPPKRTLNGE